MEVAREVGAEEGLEGSEEGIGTLLGLEEEEREASLGKMGAGDLEKCGGQGRRGGVQRIPGLQVVSLLPLQLSLWDILSDVLHWSLKFFLSIF